MKHVKELESTILRQAVQITRLQAEQNCVSELDKSVSAVDESSEYEIIASTELETRNK